MADSTLAVIRKLKDTTGQYLWQPALTAGVPDRLLGFPVHTSQFVPAVGQDREPQPRAETLSACPLCDHHAEGWY